MLVMVILAGWTLWHDVASYAEQTWLNGSTYAVRAYGTETACHAGRREAIAHEAQARRGPLAAVLTDGLIVRDANGVHATTFRYRCAPISARFGP